MTDVKLYPCKGCLTLKPFEAFGSNRSLAAGRATHCLVCERNRKRRERATPEGRAAHLAAVQRAHAKRAGRLLVAPPGTTCA
jgi:hypothetical protein